MLAVIHIINIKKDHSSQQSACFCVHGRVLRASHVNNEFNIGSKRNQDQVPKVFEPSNLLFIFLGVTQFLENCWVKHTLLK